MATITDTIQAAIDEAKKNAQAQNINTTGTISSVVPTSTDPYAGTQYANPYSTYNNPYAAGSAERTAAGANTAASTEAEATTGYNKVSGLISPFMSGKKGASLIKDVYNPATQRIYDWNANQDQLSSALIAGQNAKSQEWTAGVPEKQKADALAKIQLLEPFKDDITGGGRARYYAALNAYNKLIGQLAVAEPTTPNPVFTPGQPPADVGKIGAGMGQELITPPTDTGSSNTTEIKKRYIAASSNAASTSVGLDKWITQADLNSDDIAYQDYSDYQALVNKLRGYADADLAFDQTDIDTLEKWTNAFKQLLSGGNNTAKMGPGDTNKLWATIKQKNGI